ncbi:MAG: hypothetical protein AMJ54_11505 [Deltaproteobacteria bacterium SG8_13]|nr:MAG: hypothetical protein AMJ54_11505 [Deltaproteobacteria bacterium SG8_13]
MTSKRLLILVLLIGLGIYFGYGEGDSRNGLMASVTRFLGGPAADKERLESLYQELEAKKSILAQMDADIKRMLANPPKSSCDGGTVQVFIRDDPRPELRKEIEMLRVEIGELEAELHE